MGLRERAALDARSFLEDTTSGFGRAFTLRSPDGVSASLTGYTNDIAEVIDPETGQAVAGRLASVAVSLAALTTMPEAVASASRKPWVVTMASIAGVVADWKVIDVKPDRALGVVVLMLEGYHAGAHI